MMCGCSQKTVARGCNREDSVMKRDLYAEVSTRIVSELERGAAPWIKPWSATAGMNTPCNALTNRPYSGSNVVLLWMAQTAGYRTPRYLTFKQALDLGGNVRKGEHGTKVYFVKQLQVADRNGEEGKTRIVPMMREYTVFNVDQCEGLPDRVLTLGEVKVRNTDQRDATIDEFLGSSGVEIREGMGEAYYRPEIGPVCVGNGAALAQAREQNSRDFRAVRTSRPRP
jgi:antirestriction protein ArdC